MVRVRTVDPIRHVMDIIQIVRVHLRVRHVQDVHHMGHVVVVQ